HFQFEADRRAIIITINSFGTELTKDDRAKLYPKCGKLNPDGLAALSRADDYEQVKAVAEYYAVSNIFLLVNLDIGGACQLLLLSVLMYLLTP
ncbi:V-type proton ATPase subunit d-like, partial [Diaphorina citri]|uniref:V-type proton ATPase subunit d-like n=1 Tax=Diaphorina citri TaxID=121845 RepID=A0A3Q0JKE2_DIACI